MPLKTANKPALTQKKITPAYLIRLAAFFGFSLSIVLYFTFAPMVNKQFYTIEVLFKPIKCKEYVSSWKGRRAIEVQFENESGTKLAGLYFPGPSNKKVILVHHGQYGNINTHIQYCDFLLTPENSLFIYDYAGFGKSEGSPTISGTLDDTSAAYQCLVNKLKIDPAHIIHYGGSLGSGPAAQIAAEKECAALILISPYKSIKTAAKDFFPFLNIYPDVLLVDSDFDTIENIKKLKAPLLVVHGTGDASIGIRHGDQIFASANQPKTYFRVENGSHNVTGTEAIQKRILDFIENQVSEIL